jgi:hypothetical protein
LAPNHVACRAPDTNDHDPVTRQPPGARTSRAPGPCPHASTPRGSSNNSCATAGGMYADAIEQPEPWPMHHAALASPSAIASTQRT